jgi:hypothetical protein
MIKSPISDILGAALTVTLNVVDALDLPSLTKIVMY